MEEFKEMHVQLIKGEKFVHVLYNGKRYTMRELSDLTGIKMGTLGTARKDCNQNSKQFEFWLNNMRWKMHHGYNTRSRVILKNGERRIYKAPKRKPKGKYESDWKGLGFKTRKEPKKPVTGYDPHDPSTYRFVVNGEEYIGAR